MSLPVYLSSVCVAFIFLHVFYPRSCHQPHPFLLFIHTTVQVLFVLSARQQLPAACSLPAHRLHIECSHAYPSGSHPSLPTFAAIIAAISLPPSNCPFATTYSRRRHHHCCGEIRTTESPGRASASADLEGRSWVTDLEQRASRTASCSSGLHPLPTRPPRRHR